MRLFLKWPEIWFTSHKNVPPPELLTLDIILPLCLFFSIASL
jgi:hypothetical protein